MISNLTNAIKKMDTKMIFIVVICVLALIYIIYYMYNNKKEGIENVVDDKNMTIAKKVYKYYMDKDTFDFVDYINYLTSIGNINLELIELEVFYELKSLKKKKILTLQDVLKQMTLKASNVKKESKETKNVDGQRLKDNHELMKSILTPYVI